MDLHTAARVPDWELVCVEDQNRWQRIAAKTNGIVTPANAVTLTGNILTFGGVVALSRGKTLLGISAIAAGRAADVLDGRVAQATGTKSPLGEAFDAGFDKVQALAAFPILASNGRVSKVEAAIICGQQVISSSLSLIAKLKRNEIHPTTTGKLSTATGWTSMLAHAIANESSGQFAESMHVIGSLSTAATAILGGDAIAGYARAAFVKND